MAKWIVVSGLDGSGKTTLVDDLERWLKENNKRVMRSRLPYDEYLVKKLLNVSNDSYTDRMLFALDNRIFAEHFKKWQDSKEYDIILLDIDLPGMNGIELGKKILRESKDTVLIYLTSYTEYAWESYMIEAYQYILKSNMEERLPLILRNCLVILLVLR